MRGTLAKVEKNAVLQMGDVHGGEVGAAIEARAYEKSKRRKGYGRLERVTSNERLDVGERGDGQGAAHAN